MACTVRGSGDTDKEHLLRSSEMETPESWDSVGMAASVHGTAGMCEPPASLLVQILGEQERPDKCCFP